jgi:23S rRNA pseudouridine1911/1915/1917 synthase
MQHAEFPVESAVRLDAFLTEKLGETRNQVAQLIKLGTVTVDGKPAAKPGLKLKGGEQVRIDFPEAQETPALDVDFDVDVIYEDEALMVLNKPNGVTVHPAPSVKEATLVDWLKQRGVRLSTISGEERHGIVHRLDKGTSGLMVIAKSNAAHEALSLQLQDKSMGRFYLAVVTPPMKEELTLIDAPVGRSPANRLKMAKVPHGKPAQTLFKKLLPSRDEKRELIACKLFTGRTHQIRVHLETISRHIIGDHLYGVKSTDAKMARILLHAYVLYFTHPVTGKRMTFTADIPDIMRDYLQKHFETETLDEIITADSIERCFDSELL